jgi:hypothetical protein
LRARPEFGRRIVGAFGLTLIPTPFRAIGTFGTLPNNEHHILDNDARRREASKGPDEFKATKGADDNLKRIDDVVVRGTHGALPDRDCHATGGAYL